MMRFGLRRWSLLVVLWSSACGLGNQAQTSMVLPTEMLLPTAPPTALPTDTIELSTFTIAPTFTMGGTDTAIPPTWMPNSVPTNTAQPPSATMLPSLTPITPPTATFTLTPAPEGDATVTGNDGANLRTGPSASFAPPLRLLPKGTELLLAGRSADGEWFDVRTFDGLAGWVFADLVTTHRDIAGLPVTITSNATVMATGSTARFAVIGDFGNDSEAEREVADLVNSWNPEFIVTTGDNNYPTGEASTIDANVGQYYHDYIYPYLGTYGPGAASNRFFPTIGNHDWHNGDLSPYLNYFTLPDNERYYDFIWGPLHFFIIDSNEGEPDGISPESVQGQWLQRELAASPARFQVVVMHHPPYSSGSHYGSIDDMQWPYGEWGADLVMSGHEHIYERLIIDNVVYVVNGLGGGHQYELDGDRPGSILNYNSDHGAMLFTVDETTLNMKFITRTGVMIDDYTMNLP